GADHPLAVQRDLAAPDMPERFAQREEKEQGEQRRGRRLINAAECLMKKSMSTAAPEKSPEACRCPRPYRLGKRQEAMDQKRLQILQAARQLLLERGFPRFTMEAVAREAGVTRQTVHNQFGSRAALLEALCDFAAIEGGLDRLPEALGQADPLAALEKFVELFVAFWAS